MSWSIPLCVRLIAVCAVVTAACANMPAAMAQDDAGSAPAFAGVGEVLLRSPRVGNEEAAQTCGAGRGEFMDGLAQALKVSGVPIIRELGARPPVIGVARVDLVPEIVSLSRRSVGDCISWVALTVQTQNTVRIPPIDAPRSITAVYWRKGKLISTGEIAHGRAVSDAMMDMARDLANQYRIDQPPALPDWK